MRFENVCVFTSTTEIENSFRLFPRPCIVQMARLSTTTSNKILRNHRNDENHQYDQGTEYQKKIKVAVYINFDGERIDV